MGNSSSKKPTDTGFVGFYIPVIGLSEHLALVKTAWYMRDLRPAPYCDHPDGDTLYVYLTPPDCSIAPPKTVAKAPHTSIDNLIRNSSWYTSKYHIKHSSPHYQLGALRDAEVEAQQAQQAQEAAHPSTSPLTPSRPIPALPPYYAIDKNSTCDIRCPVSYQAGYFVPDVRVKILKPAGYDAAIASLEHPAPTAGPKGKNDSSALSTNDHEDDMTPRHVFQSIPTIHDTTHHAHDSLPSESEDDFVEVCAVFRYPTTSTRVYGNLNKTYKGVYQCVIDISGITPATCHLIPPRTPRFNSPRLFYYSLFHQLAANTSTIPFFIVTLDLCSRTSLFYFLYAFNTLVYAYNNNCLYFDPTTPILLTLFNTMQIDQCLVTESEIRQLFSALPWNIQFYNYGYPIPTTYDALPTTAPPTSPTPAATSSTPASPPPTAASIPNTSTGPAPNVMPMPAPILVPTTTPSATTASTPPSDESYNALPNQHALLNDHEDELNTPEATSRRHFATTLDRLFLSAFQHNYSVLPPARIKSLTLSHDVRYQRRFITISPERLFTYKHTLSPPVTTPVKFPLRVPMRINPDHGKLSPLSTLPSHMFHWCIFDHDCDCVAQGDAKDDLDTSDDDTDDEESSEEESLDSEDIDIASSISSVLSRCSASDSSAGDQDQDQDDSQTNNSVAPLPDHVMDRIDVQNSSPLTPGGEERVAQMNALVHSSSHDGSLLSLFTQPAQTHHCVSLFGMVEIIDLIKYMDPPEHLAQATKLVNAAVQDHMFHFLSAPYQSSHPTTDLTLNSPTHDQQRQQQQQQPPQPQPSCPTIYHATVEPCKSLKFSPDQKKNEFKPRQYYDQIKVTLEPNHITPLASSSTPSLAPSSMQSTEPTSPTVQSAAASTQTTSTIAINTSSTSQSLPQPPASTTFHTTATNPHQIYATIHLTDSMLTEINAQQLSKSVAERKASPAAILHQFPQDSINYLTNALTTSSPAPAEEPQSTTQSTTPTPTLITPLTRLPYHFQLKIQRYSSHLHYMATVPFDNLFVVSVVMQSELAHLTTLRQCYTSALKLDDPASGSGEQFAQRLFPSTSTSSTTTTSSSISASASNPTTPSSPTPITTTMTTNVHNIDDYFDRALVPPYPRFQQAALAVMHGKAAAHFPPIDSARTKMHVESALAFFDTVQVQPCPHLVLIVDDVRVCHLDKERKDEKQRKRAERAQIKEVKASADTTNAVSTTPTTTSATTDNDLQQQQQPRQEDPCEATASPTAETAPAAPAAADSSPPTTLSLAEKMAMAYDFFTFTKPHSKHPPLPQYSRHFAFVDDVTQLHPLFVDMARLAVADRMTRYDQFE